MGLNPSDPWKTFLGARSLRHCSSQNTVSEDFAAWCKLVSKELRFNYLIALESAEWFDFKSRLSLIVWVNIVVDSD